MAYTPRYLNKSRSSGFQLDLNDPEILGRIATNLGISPQKPQANILERILGVLRGIGSLPDAYKDSQTNRSSLLKEYMDNLGGGLSTTFLGTKPEEDFATSSDILKDWGILAGEDMGSKIGRGALGFIADIALDPSTYISFGAGSLGKKLGQEAVEVGAKTAAKSAAPTALKILGKQVTTNPIAVGTAKAVFNPLGEIVKGGAKLAMKTDMGQEVAKGLAKAFDEDAYVKLLEKENPGIGKILKLVREKDRLISGGDAWTVEANTPLRKALDALPENVKDIFARVIEAKPGDIENLISQNLITPELMPLVKQVAERNSIVEDALVKTGILAKETIGTRGDKLFNDFNNAVKKARIALTAKGAGEGEIQGLLGDTGPMADINPVMNFLRQATGSESKDYVNTLKTLGGLDVKTEDLPILAKRVLETFGDKIPNSANLPFKDQLAQLAAKAPERLGVPYFARDVLSFSQDYIKNKFGVDADFILNEPSVIKELADPNIAGVTKETLGRVLNKNPQFLKAKGIVDPVKFLEDAANERTFQYLADGEAAGIRYSKDIGRLFMTGQVRANRALIEDEIVKALRNMTEDGQKLLLTQNEAIEQWGKIPATWKTKTFKTGSGSFLPDRIAAGEEIGNVSQMGKKVERLMTTRAQKVAELQSELNNLNKQGLKVSLKGLSERTMKEVNLQAEARKVASILKPEESSAALKLFTDWESTLKSKGINPSVLTVARKGFFNNDGDAGATYAAIKNYVTRNKPMAKAIQDTYGGNLLESIQRLTDDFLNKAKGVDPAQWKASLEVISKGMTPNKVRDAVGNLVTPTIPGLKTIQNKIGNRTEKFEQLKEIVNKLDAELQLLDKQKGKLASSLKYMAGETTLAAPREVIDIINNNLGNFAGDESVANFMKLYDKGMSIFKASVTSRGPGFIGYNIRNAVGDMVNMVAGGFRNKGLDNGDAFGEAKKIMDFRKALETLGEEGAIKKYGEKMASKYKNVLNSGILSSSQITEALGGRADELLGKRGTSKITDKVLRAIDVGTFKDAARYREDYFRVANLIDNVSRAGGDWEAGAKLARLSSLDYNALTSFEKGTMKRIIPFYSFMRQNMKFHLDNFQKNPGVYAGYMHAMDGVKNIMESEGVTAEDYAALPDWMKTGFAVVTGKAGGLASVLTQTGDPIEALNDLNPLNIAASGMSPALRAPIEYLTQRNLFTGETFDSPSSRSGARYKDMPDAIKKFLKYREVERISKDGKKYIDYTVDPVRAKILGDLPIVSPLMTTNKRVIEAAKDPSIQKLLTLLTGTRFYDVNLEREMSAREKEQLERIKRALVYEGYGKESPPRFYFPQEEKSNLQSLLK